MYSHLLSYRWPPASTLSLIHLIIFLKNYFSFLLEVCVYVQNNFMFTTKLRGSIEISHIFTPSHARPPLLSTSLTRMVVVSGGGFWEGGLFCLVLFFTKDEPMLAHHYHPKSIIYLRVVHSLSVAHSIDLDKSIVKYIHHYNISQSASLKIPELCPFIFPATHHPWQPPIFILAP